MELDDIDSIAVLGAGSMGHGIAEVAALAGYDVVLRDIEEELVQEGYDQIEWSLNKLADKDRLDESPGAVLDRLDTAVDLETAVKDVDFVIEAAPEKMDLKKEIYSDLDDFTHDEAILATNTSSLSITEIATATDRPDKVCGTHFFNPPVMMQLVEVIYGEETSDETAEVAHALMEDFGKTPIYVRKDVNGFVVNRVLGPFMDEPAWMVSNDEAAIRQADAALSHGRGYPMGPFELSDLTGIDVGYHIAREAGRENPPIVKEKVEAEEYGRKSGRGYYDYENGGVDYEPDDAEGFDTLRVEARMISEAAWLIGQDVATAEAIDTGMKLGTGFPEGICRRADKIGLDTVLEKLETLYEETGEERYKPAEYLRELVEQGRTGEESGAGFYEYGEDEGMRDFHNLNYDLSDDGVLSIEIDREQRLNALSPDLNEEIVHLLENVDTDDVRCVTFEGAGDQAFSAGADISSFGEMAPHETLDVESMWETVYEFPRPTIALIQGYCLGGGLELALACDLRIATDDSELGFPEINLGLIPGAGGTQRIMRLLGETRGKELVFRGNHISAEKAEEWGLINRCVSKDEFDEVAREYIDDIAGGPPIALRMAKKVMNQAHDVNLDGGLELEQQAFAILTTTEDVIEGTAKFFSDEEPDFKGK